MWCSDGCVIAVRSFAIAGLVTFGAGCNANYPQGPTPTPTLAGIQLHYSTPHTSIPPRSSAFLILYAIDTEGVYENVSTRATWFSTNSSVLNAGPNGNASSIQDGTADVIASYQGLTTTARVVVLTSLSPTDLVLSFVRGPEVGKTEQVTARVQNVARTDVTGQCTWTSSDPGVFTVEGGLITGRGPGTAVMTVRFSLGTPTTVYLSVPPIRSLP